MKAGLKLQSNSLHGAETGEGSLRFYYMIWVPAGNTHGLWTGGIDLPVTDGIYLRVPSSQQYVYSLCQSLGRLSPRPFSETRVPGLVDMDYGASRWGFLVPSLYNFLSFVRALLGRSQAAD